MRPEDLRGRRIAIWGYGREGQATHRYIAPFEPAEIIIVSDSALDDGQTAVAGQLGDPAFRTSDRMFEAPAPEIVIKSPGISLYRPEAETARERGITLTSATNIWFAANPDARVVGVTGTKGKSTTASLLAHLLRSAGQACMLAGNIGKPLLDLPKPKAEETWIVELSSYQTADLNRRPPIALLVNLYPEHVDWHGSVERYYGDKLNLFRPGSGQCVIVNGADPNTAARTEDWQDVIRYNGKPGSDWPRVENGRIWIGDRLVDAGAFPLPGLHNLSNLCAALTAAMVLGCDPETCLAEIGDFQGLAHRLQVIGNREGVTYVDDSISTTPESAIAALDAMNADPRFGPVTILLGGHDRKQDYRRLATRLTAGGISGIVTMPGNGPAIAAACRAAMADAPMPPVAESVNLTEAVIIARELTPRGGTILLSPAAPSYGLFRNFEERGAAFAAAAGLA